MNTQMIPPRPKIANTIAMIVGRTKRIDHLCGHFYTENLTTVTTPLISRDKKQMNSQ